MSFNLQQQIRQNASDIREYIEDLYEWEETQGNVQPAKRPQKQNIPPPRGVVEIEKQQVLKRDGNTIKDYYDAWAKVDINEELVEPKIFEQRETKPNAKVVIKGGVSQQSKINVKKEEANTLFKAGKYQEALLKYQECLNEYSNDPEQLVIIHSNKALVYTKLGDYSRTIQECNAALQIDENHIKSLLRRQNALQLMGRWRQALQDCEKLEQLGEQEAKSLAKQLRTKLEKKKKAAKDQLKNVQKMEDYIIIEVEDVERMEIKNSYLNNLD